MEKFETSESLQLLKEDYNLDKFTDKYFVEKEL